MGVEDDSLSVVMVKYGCGGLRREEEDGRGSAGCWSRPALLVVVLGVLSPQPLLGDLVLPLDLVEPPLDRPDLLALLLESVSFRLREDGGLLLGELCRGGLVKGRGGGGGGGETSGPKDERKAASIDAGGGRCRERDDELTSRSYRSRSR